MLVKQTPALATLQGADLTFVMANEACRALVGHRDLIGQTVADVVAQAAAQKLMAVLDQVRRTGEGAVMDAMRADFFVDTFGAPVDLFVDIVVVPARGRDGTVTGVHVQIVDATERVVTQRLLRAHLPKPRDAAARPVGSSQDASLPAKLLMLPQLNVAAHCLLADQDDADDAAAGGDWYDAVLRPDGRVALVVGEVVGGYDIAASATLGQLRAVLHDHLLARSRSASFSRRWTGSHGSPRELTSPPCA